MTFSERTKITLLNAFAVSMAVAGPAFAIFNSVSGRQHLLPFNAVLTVAGVATLGLALYGARRTAFAVMMGGASLVFLAGGMVYRNGVENYLLIIIAAAMFMVDARRDRVVIAIVYGMAFVVVRITHFEFYEQAGVSRGLYAVNTILFVASLFGILELFRSLNSEYRKVIEEKNEGLRAATGHLEASNRTREQLLSVVAHDLRGPVGSLLQTLEMIEEGSLKTDDFRSLLPQLRIETATVHESLESLLAWARDLLRDHEPELVSMALRPEAMAAVRLLLPAAAPKRIVIQNEVPDDVIVRSDRERVRIVLRNLISNAVKFSPVEARVLVEAIPEHGGWRVRVSDHGAGMTPERVTEVFEDRILTPGTGTNAEAGCGLGLQLCRTFLEHLGSRLEVQSTPGRGTVMSFFLPGGG